MTKIRLETIIDGIENTDVKTVIRKLNKDLELLRELYINTGINADKNIPRSTSQALYHFANKIMEIPFCICGKPRLFKDYNNGYNLSCGNSTCRYEIKKQTCLKRYGVEHALQNIEIKNKMIATNNSKYGVDFTWQSESIKSTIRDSMQFSHGVNSFLEKEEIRAMGIKKLIENNNKLYGVDHIMQTEKYFDNIKRAGYKLKSYKFPSGKIVNVQGYENLALDELLKKYHEDDIITDNIEICKHIGKIIWVSSDGKSHRYYPDIYIKSDHIIYEIKSTWSFSLDIETNNKKMNACKHKNVDFKFMIYEKNSKKWSYAS